MCPGEEEHDLSAHEDNLREVHRLMLAEVSEQLLNMLMS